MNKIFLFNYIMKGKTLLSLLLSSILLLIIIWSLNFHFSGKQEVYLQYTIIEWSQIILDSLYILEKEPQIQTIIKESKFKGAGAESGRVYVPKQENFKEVDYIKRDTLVTSTTIKQTYDDVSYVITGLIGLINGLFGLIYLYQKILGKR